MFQLLLESRITINIVIDIVIDIIIDIIIDIWIDLFVQQCNTIISNDDDDEGTSRFYSVWSHNTTTFWYR